MKNLHNIWAIFCLTITITIANISAQAFGSYEEYPDYSYNEQEYAEYLIRGKEKSDVFASAIKELTSQIVGRVEVHREECPNLPERSAAENQLKPCLQETFKKLTDEQGHPFIHTQKAGCNALGNFLKCSSSLVDEMVNCGKNLDLITILGFAKAACQFEEQKGYKGIEELESEMRPCRSEFGDAMDECGMEKMVALGLKDINSVEKMLDLFCAIGKVVRECATVALKKHCPKVFVEVSTIYQSSRSLSGNSVAFDTCLVGSSSRSIRESEPYPWPDTDSYEQYDNNKPDCYPKCTSIG